MKQIWTRHCATIQQVLILKFAFGPEKLVGLSRSRPQGSKKNLGLLPVLFTGQEYFGHVFLLTGQTNLNILT